MSMSPARQLHLEGHILLVEDDELTGTYLTKELQHKGLKCDWVKTHRDAEEAIKKMTYHAVVTDVYLDDGKSGLDIVKALDPLGIPVIVITSKADLEIAKSSLNSGAIQLLEKPFEISALLRALESAWDQPRGLTGVVEHYLEVNHFTPKEKEIARYLLKGLSNREIADVMGNTEKTIKFHLTVIFQKSGVKSRTEFFNSIFPT